MVIIDISRFPLKQSEADIEDVAMDRTWFDLKVLSEQMLKHGIQQNWILAEISQNFKGGFCRYLIVRITVRIKLCLFFID